HQAGTGYDFAVARFTAEGQQDQAFGNSGMTAIDFNHSRDDEAGSVAIQPDGKIVIFGSTISPLADGDFAVARLEGDDLTSLGVPSQLVQFITTANLTGQPDAVTLQAISQSDVDTIIAAINALPAATTADTITLNLGGNTFSTNGVAL